MADKPVLLMVGGARPGMRARLDERFEVLEAADGLPPEGRGDEVVGVTVNAGVACPAATIDAVPNAKVIANFGVGYDNVDAAHAASSGIIVTHTPDVLNDEVANTTILLLLAADRRLVAYDAYVRDGSWEAKGAPPLTRGIRGKTVGIIGLGRIGTTIAEKLSGCFGAEIAYHSRSSKDAPYRYYDDLVAMARDADALVVITPGGPETEKLVSREVMEALGPDGTLVNVARGTVVDEEAMIDLLESGALGRAGLDVFEREPHVPERLRALSNVTLAPHIGSATEETRNAMGDLVVDNAIAVTEGRAPLTTVPECRHLLG